MIVLVLYPGCIPLEVMLAVELAERPVCTATPDGRSLRAASGLTFAADADFASAPRGDAVLIPGGDPYALLGDTAIDALLHRHEGALLAAICAGPLVLAKAGLLRGRRFTHGYGDAHADVLAPYWEGATYVEAPLVRDGNVLTAQPQAHVDFGAAFAQALGALDDAAAERARRFYKGERRYRSA